MADPLWLVILVPKFGALYRVDSNGVLSLIPNQPFKTKREAIRELGIHISVLNKYLDTSEVFRDMLFFTSPRQL